MTSPDVLLRRLAQSMVAGVRDRAYAVRNGRLSALNKADVGLSNVDNTSDVDKPVSTATQTALDLKQDKTTALTSFVGLSLSANQLPYATGPGAYALTSLTVFGRQLIASADEAAGRTALGLGTAATHAVTTGPNDTTGSRLWRTDDLIKQTNTLDDTSGRVLTVGAAGLLRYGSAAQRTLNDTGIGQGFFGFIAADPNSPDGYRGGFIESGWAESERWQLTINPADETARFRCRYSGAAGVWKGWRTIWTDANFNRQALPAENQMRDSGRFAGLVDPLNLFVTTFGNVTGILHPYQPGSAWTSAGQFFHDNSTNGGARGALTQDVVDLIAAMGRTGNPARYGVEFFVGTLNTGTGTAVPNVGADGTTRYLAIVNNSQALAGPGNRITFVGWVRAKTGSAHLVITNADTWVNGVKATNNIVLPANTWVHVRQIVVTPAGYDNGFPRVYATVGANIQFACPAVFAGEVDVGLHTAPIATSPVLKDVLAIQPSSSAGWDDLTTVAISSGVLTLNLANPAAFKVTLNQNITSVVFQNVPSGKSVAFTVEFLQDATGRRTITWPSAVRAADGSTPFQPLSNPNARTVMTFVTSDAGATIWQNTDVQTSGGLPMPRTAATIRSVAGAINGTALTTMAATAQRIVLVPFTVSRDMDITQLGISISTAVAGTGSLAIYASDGDPVLGTPGTRLIATATGALNTGTVGTKAAAATGKLLAGQVYYAAVICSAGATMRALALAGACPLGFTDNAATAVMYYFLAGSAVTLPASLAGVALSTATTVPPAIYLIE